MAGVPAVSIYRADPIIRLLASRIKVWTAALPNLIADYPVIPGNISTSCSVRERQRAGLTD